MVDVRAIEELRLARQAKLDSDRSSVFRNRAGQFATPPALATEILAYAKTLWRDGEKVRFLDPAIGTGSFYSALRQVFPQQAITEAAGIELDRGFANACKRLWGSAGLHVICKDFTKLEPRQPHDRFNLVIANPPYVRHHHLTTDAKKYLQKKVREILGIHVSGLSGLYVYFILLCHRWMSLDGLAIWLVPAEFMDVNYGGALKEYLLDKVTLVRVHRFDPNKVQFDDALVSSAVLVIRNTPPSPGYRVEMTYGGSLRQPSTIKAVPLDVLRGVNKWGRFSRSVPSWESEPAVAKLGDIFEIKRGIATGANSYYILTPDVARRYGLPKSCLRPILPSPRYISTGVIEALPDGTPRVDPNLLLVDCHLADHEVRDQYPSLWSYLQQGITAGINLRYLAQSRSPWYAQEKRPVAPFLCSYMGRSGLNKKSPFRFFWNKSNATAGNVYLLLYPKAALASALQRSPELYPNVYNALNSLTSEVIMSEARTYGGGLHKIEPSELARVSIPATIVNYCTVQ